MSTARETDSQTGRDGGSAPRGGLADHALFLDIDGTLLDLAPSPEAVEVPLGTRSLLQQLADKLGGAMAFVSGRTIAAIDQLFRPLVLPAIGVHGGETREPSGELIVDQHLTQELQCAEPALRAAIARMRGVVLENKRCAIALHYRGAPERGREVLKMAELVAGSLGADYGVLLGKCVVEIRPRHLTKGIAIERLMQRAPFLGRTPIFAGDDSTDEDGFEVVNRLGGISLHVGESMSTVAKCRVSTPDQLRGWLQQLNQS